MTRENIIDWAKIIAVLVIIVLCGLVLFEYIWPSRASWREECVTGHYVVVPTSSCSTTSSGSHCTSGSETRFVCDRSVWRCRKGRDGSTICRSPMPSGPVVGGGGW